MRDIECRPRRCSNPNDRFGLVRWHVSNVLELDIHLIGNVPVGQVHELIPRWWLAPVVDSRLLLQKLEVLIHLALFVLEILQLTLHFFVFCRVLDGLLRKLCAIFCQWTLSAFLAVGGLGLSPSRGREAFRDNLRGRFRWILVPRYVVFPPFYQ